MYSFYNNSIENEAFKRALFAVLLTKFDRVGIIPGNEEGVLYFVSFLVLVPVLLCMYVYHSLDIVLSGGKTKTGELSYTSPRVTPSRLNKLRGT